MSIDESRRCYIGARNGRIDAGEVDIAGTQTSIDVHTSIQRSVYAFGITENRAICTASVGVIADGKVTFAFASVTDEKMQYKIIGF